MMVRLVAELYFIIAKTDAMITICKATKKSDPKLANLGRFYYSFFAVIVVSDSRSFLRLHLPSLKKTC